MKPKEADMLGYLDKLPLSVRDGLPKKTQLLADIGEACGFEEIVSNTEPDDLPDRERD